VHQVSFEELVAYGYGIFTFEGGGSLSDPGAVELVLESGCDRRRTWSQPFDDPPWDCSQRLGGGCGRQTRCRHVHGGTGASSGPSAGGQAPGAVALASGYVEASALALSTPATKPGLQPRGMPPP